MARRRKDQGQALLIVLLLLVGVPLYILFKLTSSVGAPVVIIGVLVILVAVIWYRSHQQAIRLAALRPKYGDEQIVQNILRRLYWHGQTAEMLSDSIGHPVAKDDQRLKTKKREVWKYQQSGVNRYKLRITLENDIVTEWDHKR